MPRPLRVHLEGALYYVMSRAVEGSQLFKDDQDYAAYVELLQQAGRQAGAQMTLYGIVLLPDQLHLCLEPTGELTISAFMQGIHSRYTKYFAKRYGPINHVFQDRFKSTLLEKAPSLLRLTGYLHTLPPRLGLAKDVRGYRWSTVFQYLPAESSLRLLTDEATQAVQRALASEHPGLTYDAYLQSIPEQEWNHLRAELHRPIVGEPAFVALATRRAAIRNRAEDARTVVVPVAKGAGRLRRESHAMLTASMALAFLAICMTGLYAVNLSSLRDTIGALVYERTLQLRGLPAGTTAPRGDAAASLASFRLPVQLNNAQVTVSVRALAGDADQVAQQDVLEFRDGKLHSHVLGDQGFAPSKYVVTRREDGVVAWETALADKTGIIVYWRGEWDGQTMRGMLTQCVPGKHPVTSNFVGTGHGHSDGNGSRQGV